MQICEYDNVKCPYCGEENNMIEISRCHIVLPPSGADKSAGISTSLSAHFISCRACGGVFSIPCED